MAVVATMQKRPGEEFRLSVDDYQGQTRVNIRVWWENDFGEWRPGKQGVSMTAAQFRTMLGHFPAVDAELMALGI